MPTVALQAATWKAGKPISPEVGVGRHLITISKHSIELGHRAVPYGAMARALAALPFVLLCGCDVLGETAEKPWTGYAWNAAGQRYEFLPASYATHRDCITATSKVANDVVPPSPQSKPLGCAYASNSYWKAWWNNDVGSGKPLMCVARSTAADAAARRSLYRAVLQSAFMHGDGWACVN
jgi:hypothetical protein